MSNVKVFIDKTAQSLNNLSQAIIHQGISADNEVVDLMGKMQDDICRLDNRVHEIEGN